MVVLQEFGGFLRPFAAGGVGMHVDMAGIPGIQRRLHYRPAGFHVVGALKQRGVADQAIVEQGS